MKQYSCDVLIIGAGIIGIATAYYLKKYRPNLSIILVDSGQPMALTSAQSGENYRNWWPHPVMTAFTDHSIDLMETIARESNNQINMQRRGYALATREDKFEQLMNELHTGYGEDAESLIRIHGQVHAPSYQAPRKPDWETAPSGVDVLNDHDLIHQHFPHYDHEVKTLIHIRRAGDISAQQMGQYMLDYYKAADGIQLTGEVKTIKTANGFQASLHNPSITIHAERLINAAGPFINEIAEMLGTELPVHNTLQQKIAFEDIAGVIPRDMPFSIDLDAQNIDWSAEDKALLAVDPDFAWLTQQMPGAIHCRPDGGDHGTWVKLGWAFNETAAKPVRNPELMNYFPEVVLRGAARLNPALKHYYDQLPTRMHHYGGFYTLTEENWPLIGAMDIEGAFVVGAMSGFGTMAACAGGDLCARWVLEEELPEFALPLSLQRYADLDLMNELSAQSSRGIL